MDDADPINDRSQVAQPGATPPRQSFSELKPKGACWYCNQPLDNVRRFCGKSCADDYRIEEEVFNPPPS